MIFSYIYSKNQEKSLLKYTTNYSFFWGGGACFVAVGAQML